MCQWKESFKILFQRKNEQPRITVDNQYFNGYCDTEIIIIGTFQFKSRFR